MGRAFVVAAAGAAISVIIACTKHIARPPVPEVPIRDPAETAQPALLVPPARSAPDPKTADDKSTDASPSSAPPSAPSSAPTFTLPPRDDAPEAPRDKAFPKQVDACKRDDDCAITTLSLGGDMLCCAECRPIAGAKSWVKRVEQICQQKVRAGLKTRCASFDCSRVEAECRGGHCAIK